MNTCSLEGTRSPFTGIRTIPADDLDIWVKPDAMNTAKVMAVLEDIGFGELDLTTDDFIKPGNAIQLGYPPLRIDLLTQPNEVEFSNSYAQRLDIAYGGVTVHVISLEDFKKNKAANGRAKDLEDLRNLK